MFDNVIEQRSNIRIIIGAYRKDPEAVLQQIIQATAQDMQNVFNATINMDEAAVTKKTHVRYVMDVFFDAVPAPVVEPVSEEKEEVAADE